MQYDFDTELQRRGTNSVKWDLAGPEEDSWKCRLEREGYAVRCVLRGMGELPGIQAMYVHHAREAEQTE